MQRALSILVILAALASLTPSPAQAQRMGLSNLVVDNQGGRIKVRFGVDVKNPQVVEEALAAGQVLALECKASLALKRDYLWNAKVAGAESTSPLLLHEGGPYEIQSVQGRQERFRGRDLPLLMKEAWGQMSLDLGDWNILERGNVYSLTLEIRMVRQDVSSWLSGALFFWNFDALSPVKYQLDFSY